MAERAHKLAFLTIGATAEFPALVEAAVTPHFLKALEEHEYTELLVQYGQDGKPLFDKCQKLASQSGTSIKVGGFGIDKLGLGRYMRRAKGGDKEKEGVVISHAGSGTILDALRTGVPIIVVPNETLLDNHQVELAEELASQEYVIYGRLPKLEQALQDAEVLRAKQKSWPPVNSGPAVSLKSILDEEMGFLD